LVQVIGLEKAGEYQWKMKRKTEMSLTNLMEEIVKDLKKIMPEEDAEEHKERLESLQEIVNNVRKNEKKIERLHEEGMDIIERSKSDVMLRACLVNHHPQKIVMSLGINQLLNEKDMKKSHAATLAMMIDKHFDGHMEMDRELETMLISAGVKFVLSSCFHPDKVEQIEDYMRELFNGVEVEENPTKKEKAEKDADSWEDSEKEIKITISKRKPNGRSSH